MSGPEHDERLRHLLQDLAPEEGAGAGKVDPELLVGLVENRLGPRERDAVLRQLAGSEEGRRLAATLADLDEEGLLARLEHTVPPAAGSGRGLWRWQTLAAAAVLAVAIGAGLWAAGAFTPDPGADTASRLLAASRALEQRAPDLFRGFRPLDARELEARVASRERGDLRLLLPAAQVLDPRPPFRWAAVPGATRYALEVLDARGRSVYRAVTSEAYAAFDPEQDPLSRGQTYVWEVSTSEGPLGPVTGRRTFTVVPQAEADRFERACQLAADSTPADLRDLLIAHWSLRRGYLAQAERRIRAHLARQPGDGLAQATLDHVRRRLGQDAAD